MKRLVLIDGHAIIHRAYHAFPKTLTTREGELVNAVYGFTRMLLGVIENLRPTYLVVTFDLPKPTFRHREFIGYQAQRPKADIKLIDQIERVFKVVKTLNMPIFTAEGFEADDVIGTLAFQANKKGNLETVIVTGDKDIMQLVRKRVKVYAPERGFAFGKLYGSKQVKELLGVKPERIVDYKGLVGDPSDNYPGVPGVGPKTAVDLLTRFKTFKGVYQNLDKVKPVVAERLKQGKDSGELSFKLAKIVTNAPVKFTLKDCRVHDYNQAQARALFEKLEFKSLISKLPKAEGGKYKVEKIKKEKKDSQMKLL